MKNGYLVVRTDQEQKRVHLDEISVLMIENSAVSIFIVNLRSYLGQKETEELFRSIILHKLSLICIENREYPMISCENRLIVDEDQCVI
ncbi:MAG: type II-A CRISPR-associated protein Csn2 [Oscillospiraceae bacterium]|nr:type II-A CRISPR-associated protein Csn2 [Oscillospiraceae bacterium]